MLAAFCRKIYVASPVNEVMNVLRFDDKVRTGGRHLILSLMLCTSVAERTTRIAEFNELRVRWLPIYVCEDEFRRSAVWRERPGVDLRGKRLLDKAAADGEVQLRGWAKKPL